MEISPAFYSLHSIRTSLTTRSILTFSSLRFTYSVCRERSIFRPVRRTAPRCAQMQPFLPSFLLHHNLPARPPCMSFSPRSSATGRLGKLQLQLSARCRQFYPIGSLPSCFPSRPNAPHGTASLHFARPVGWTCPVLSVLSVLSCCEYRL